MCLSLTFESLLYKGKKQTGKVTYRIHYLYKMFVYIGTFCQACDNTAIYFKTYFRSGKIKFPLQRADAASICGIFLQNGL